MAAKKKSAKPAKKLTRRTSKVSPVGSRAPRRDPSVHGVDPVDQVRANTDDPFDLEDEMDEAEFDDDHSDLRESFDELVLEIIDDIDSQLNDVRHNATDALERLKDFGKRL